jgi:hypothetical protein
VDSAMKALDFEAKPPAKVVFGAARKGTAPGGALAETVASRLFVSPGYSTAPPA